MKIDKTLNVVQSPASGVSMISYTNEHHSSNNAAKVVRKRRDFTSSVSTVIRSGIHLPNADGSQTKIVLQRRVGMTTRKTTTEHQPQTAVTVEQYPRLNKIQVARQ